MQVTATGSLSSLVGMTNVEKMETASKSQLVLPWQSVVVSQKPQKYSFHKDESKVEFKFFHRDACSFVFMAAQFTIT